MKQFSMKTGIGLLVTGALIAATAGMSRAADTTAPTTPGTGTTQPKKRKATTKKTNGTVVSATATSLVIKLGKRAGGGEKTYSVPDTAKVTSNKLPIKLDSLTAGQRVTVTTLADGTTVTRVSLQQPKAAPATTAPAK